MILPSAIAIRAFLIVLPFGHPISASLSTAPSSKKTGVYIVQSTSVSHSDGWDQLEEQKEEYAVERNHIPHMSSKRPYCLLTDMAFECMNVYGKSIYYGVKKQSSLYLFTFIYNGAADESVESYSPHKRQCEVLKATAYGDKVSGLTSLCSEIFYRYHSQNFGIGVHPRFYPTCVYATHGINNPKRHVVIASNKKLLMYSSRGERAKKWQAKEEFNHLFKGITPYKREVTGVCCTEDGNRIFVGFGMNGLYFFSNKSKTSCAVATKKNVRSLCCTPNGHLIFFAPANKNIEVWACEPALKGYQNLPYKFKKLIPSTRKYHTLSCTPDGKYLLAGGPDGRVKVWKILKTGSISLLVDKKIGEGDVKQVCVINNSKERVLIALLGQGDKSAIYADPFSLPLAITHAGTREEVQIKIFNQAKADAERAYEEMRKKLECIKWGVAPDRKKMSEQELRKRWLQAARELDFHALEWLQCDKKTGGGKKLTCIHEDGRRGEKKFFHVLHYAALDEHLPIVKDIGAALRNFPKFNALDRDGRTAMDIAYEKQNIPILKVLKGQGGRLERYKEDANLENLKKEIKNMKKSLFILDTKPFVSL